MHPACMRYVLCREKYFENWLRGGGADIIRYMDISRRLVQCAPESFYDSYTTVTSKEWQNKIPLKKCTLDTPLFGAIESRNIESDNIHADILSDIRESTLLLESTLLNCDTKCLSQECQFFDKRSTGETV